MNLKVNSFVENFPGSIDEYWVKKQHLLKMEIFCNITNVSTVPFNQFNSFLLNLFIKKKNLTDPKDNIILHYNIP